MVPNNKDELMDYCLRSLGHPVVEVNIDDDQLDDRVDEALQWFREHHPDGSKRQYLSHQLTQDDIDNGYIDFGVDVMSVVRMLPVNTVQGQTNFFDIKYQMMLNDITDLNNYAGDMAYYEQMQQHLSMLDMKLSGHPEITFDRQNNRVNFFLGKSKVPVGQYVVFEIYGVRTPNSTYEYNSLWNHPFVKSYTTALVKKQWGTNLTKFDGMTLPGGVTVNARQIYEDSLQDIEKIMEKFREEEDEGPIFFVG
tara:strand:- start:13349 stop:14101 length:753 start_codon:yes stop_codon:yes gene_type:complete